MIRDLAEKAGRRDAVYVAPRNLLNLTSSAKGSGRTAFEGSVDEIATDILQVQRLGCDYLTFDLPNVDVPGMVHTLERFVQEVKPAAN